MLPSGGGIRVLRQFTAELSNNFETSVHVPKGGSKLNTNIRTKEIFYPFPAWKKPKGLLHLTAPIFLVYRLLSFKKVCKQIAERMNNTSDIALVHNSMPIAAPPVLQYLKIPSIYFCFEHPRHIYEKSIIQRTNSLFKEIALTPLTALEKKIDYKSATSSKQIITFSTYMQKNILNFYNKPSNIVRPGIDSSFFLPPSLSDKRKDFVLSVGALWPFKGHATAIEIIGNIPVYLRPSLKIIADREFPGYQTELITLANTLSVSIDVLHGIKDSELKQLYQTTQAVLCCQRNEPYGLVPLEAMASKAPVIAINEGGFKDNVLPNETGYLFDGSIKDGSNQLISILTNSNKVKTITSTALDFVRNKRTITSGCKSLEMELNLL